MALRPEFIGLLRDIRDRIYPEISQTKDEIDVIETNIKAMEINVATMEANVENIQASIHAITIGTVTTVSVDANGNSQDADASYDGATSTLNLSIPVGSTGIQGTQGIQGPVGADGIRGDAYEPDAEGLSTERTTYDSEIKTFSFLSIDEGLLFFKLSSTSGDWSEGYPFLQGPEGEKGEDGVAANRNLLINTNFSINQRNAKETDFLSMAQGDYIYDMWRKESDTEIYQIIPSDKIIKRGSTNYTLSIVGGLGSIVNGYKTILLVPGTGDWKIVIPYEILAGTTTVQLELGSEQTIHEVAFHRGQLADCQEFYILSETPISATMVDSAMLVKKAQISFPTTMRDIPVVTLTNSTNGLTPINITESGARLSATTSSEAVRAQCDGYIASIQ